MVYNSQWKIKILQKPLKYGTLHQSTLWLWLPTTELTQKLYCQVWPSTEALTPPQPPNLHGQEVGCKGCTATRKGCPIGRPCPVPCPPPRGGGLHPAVHMSPGFSSPKGAVPQLVLLAPHHGLWVCGPVTACFHRCWLLPPRGPLH